MKTQRLMTAIAAMMIPAAAWAAGEKRITADEAVRLALQNSRTLHMAEASSGAAHQRLAEARAAERPKVTGHASYTKLSDVGPFQIQPPGAPAPTTISPSITNSYMLKLSVTKPLYNGGRIASGIAAADLSAEAAVAETARERADVVVNATAAYWNLYKAAEVKKVLDDNVRRMQAHLADMTNMVGAGVALRDEHLKVQVQLSNAKFQRMDAANNVRLAMMALNSAAGLPLDTPLETATAAAPPEGETPPLDEFRKKALETRPELSAARFRTGAAASAYNAARAASSPQVALFGDWFLANPNQRYLPNREQFDGAWDFGVMVSYDLWDSGVARAQAEQAAAAREQARWAEEQLREMVELEVNQCYLGLLQARDRIALSAEGVSQAEESGRIAKNRFANGQATSAEVMDAENALLQAEMNHALALADYEIARIKMDRATGMTGPGL